jgi:hypothetical protein
VKLPKPLEFLWEQPFHKTLRQFRIPTLIVLWVSVDILYKLVTLLESMVIGEGLSDTQAATAIVGFATVVLGAIWKGINNLAESHKEDS